MASDTAPQRTSARNERIAEERGHTLDSAMEALTTAISYAANRNTPMDTQIIEHLVALRDGYIAGRWQTTDEQAFWPIYHQFVTAVGLPLDALIISRRWSRRIAWVAAIISLAALALLVVQLSYWAALDSTIRQIDTVDRGAEAEAMTPSPPTPTAGPNTTVPARNDAEAQRCLQLTALYKLLSERVASERRYLLSKELPETMPMPATSEACFSAAANAQAMRAYVMGNARILRTARQDYVLPVLFGLLGTIAFILRSLVQDIRGARLTVTEVVGAAVRVPLGMLAGLAIGWVLGDRTDGVFGQITPWALAFLAGYSVELVFTAMDRLIGAFTGDRAPPPPNG